MGFENVNFLAVLVAAIGGMIVGFLWYSPMLFGKQWMKLSGVRKAEMKKWTMPAAFITTLITAYVLAGLTGGMGMSAAFGKAFWLWLGFIGTTTFGSILWENKPFNLWVLNNACSLVTLWVMAAIIGAWA